MSTRFREDFAGRLERLKLAGKGCGHVRLRNLNAIYEISYGVEKTCLGINKLQHFPASQLLDAISGVTGCSGDLSQIDGAGYISPEATVDGLVNATLTILNVCKKNGNVLLGTGHPGAMLSFYLEIAKLIRNLKGKLVCPGRGDVLTLQRFPEDGLSGGSEIIDYVGEVAVVSNGESLFHTHGSQAMEKIIQAAKESGTLVDLVIADHGFAGGAISGGYEVIAIMDTNDPAIAAAKCLGYHPIIVPMSDNRPNYVTVEVAQMIKQIAELHQHLPRRGDR